LGRREAPELPGERRRQERRQPRTERGRLGLAGEELLELRGAAREVDALEDAMGGAAALGRPRRVVRAAVGRRLGQAQLVEEMEAASARNRVGEVDGGEHDPSRAGPRRVEGDPDRGGGRGPRTGSGGGGGDSATGAGRRTAAGTTSRTRERATWSCARTSSSSRRHERPRSASPDRTSRSRARVAAT